MGLSGPKCIQLTFVLTTWESPNSKKWTSRVSEADLSCNSSRQLPRLGVGLDQQHYDVQAHAGVRFVQ